jgi:hypothetical protein
MTMLTKKNVEYVNLESLRPYVRGDETFFQAAGKQHYRLLASLSTWFYGRTIFDIGTNAGLSALALSYGASNNVESFDLVDNVPLPAKLRTNVRYHIGNLFEPEFREAWAGSLLESALIFIDIDPHEGVLEMEMVKWLRDNDYKGIIVLDDIWMFKGMRNNLWHLIPGRYKTDATLLGHFSGTGILSGFSGESKIECEGGEPPPDWTLVTGYFDLTTAPDANPAIAARPSEHYLEENAHATLSLDHNLVVFCEPKNRDRILRIRPKYLHEKTKIVEMEFEDFPLTGYRDRIIANRGGGSCHTDPRNTASYYLFCMARYAMLKQTIVENPFQSGHFAWINICIERMGYDNLVHLNEALSLYREKFSTCWIDYIPPKLVRDFDNYFCGKDCVGRCSFCSGFFTGNAQYMRAVCTEVEQQFLKCLDAGYGHADEQLFNLVYLEYPELFDWYVGDYGEMITNYAKVYENATSPINNLIRNSHLHGDYEVCWKACDQVLQSYLSGCVDLSSEQLESLVSVRDRCFG